MIPSRVGTRAAAVASVLAVASGCGADDGAAGPEATTPVDPADLIEPGDHGVGFTRWTTTWASPPDGTDRTVKVFAWYPAEAASAAAAPRANYQLSDSQRAGVDAAAAAGGPWPLVANSHGHQGYAESVSFLAEHLATHGFVTVSVEHTGNTFLDGDDRTAEIYFQRPLEVAEMVDSIAEHAERLGGVDARRYLLMGHSFGGYAALVAGGARHDVDGLRARCDGEAPRHGYCDGLTSAMEEVFRGDLSDARVAGIVALDAGDADLFGETGLQGVRSPVLQLVAEIGRDEDAAADPFWSKLPTGVGMHRRVWVRGAGHNDFIDSCSAGIALRCGDIPVDEMQPLVRAWILAFARERLSADASVRALLAGDPSVSERARLTLCDGCEP